MATPPENKESNTFSVTIDDLDSIPEEFLSPVYRINGYPWRLKVVRLDDDVLDHELILICDKSSEAELWKCTANIIVTRTDYGVQYYEKLFTSWDNEQSLRIGFVLHNHNYNYNRVPERHKIQIKVTIKEDGNSIPDHSRMIYRCTSSLITTSTNERNRHERTIMLRRMVDSDDPLGRGSVDNVEPELWARYGRAHRRHYTRYRYRVCWMLF
ncbi:hypothetical protein PRIPAC_92014 [Pristionchus pacificus]|uniref:MATH domain-containing protein n=1 Tax=Pristionchus pacificus TaxID=54126 RepID=A0A2A6CIJ3_PRIPA|nr:hypothetical protein PRIPAC_92014 [Pristionchus pacificus]|eukprot:PDM77898.1 hypothetical protein PRIPAC_34765 [Pristionchus pacificus]